jgi:hypothetical protein
MVLMKVGGEQQKRELDDDDDGVVGVGRYTVM